MSSGMTPSQLLEIRRVKAMIAGAGTTMDPTCFLGPTGATGPTGPTGAAGSTGNYGTPASLGYYNYTNTQLIPNATPTRVPWLFQDQDFSQGTTGIDYSNGKFTNTSDTDGILANVSGFISFGPNSHGMRGVYGQLNGIAGSIYGYTKVTATDSIDINGTRPAFQPESIVSFSFNVFLAKDKYFEIYVYQDSGNVYQDSGNLAGLNINSSISRISIVRMNTTMMGATGPIGPTGAAGATGAAGSDNIVETL